MKPIFVLSALILFALSCKLRPTTAGTNPGDSKTYHLRLTPPSGSAYHYQVTNDQSLIEEVDDKTIKNTRTTDVGVDYVIARDSAGNLVLTMTYDKIRLHTGTGDEVADLDAANAATSTDPVEKMLGSLKAATITATVTPAGTVKSVRGYQDIGNELLAKVQTGFGNKAKAEMQWRQLIEQGIIRKNMDQLFKIFPDSAVHVGDKWKIFSKETNELTFTVRNFYTLRSIEDGIANIGSEGDITTDSTISNVMGYDVMAHLTGKQEGEYSMDMQTGMLIRSTVKATIDGTMELAGKEVSLKIRTKNNMEGQKTK